MLLLLALLLLLIVWETIGEAPRSCEAWLPEPVRLPPDTRNESPVGLSGTEGPPVEAASPEPSGMATLTAPGPVVGRGGRGSVG